MAAAAKLHEMGRLSTGTAARLAGVPRSVLLTRMADYRVDTFDLDEMDLDEETRLVRTHLRHVTASVPAPDWSPGNPSRVGGAGAGPVRRRQRTGQGPSVGCEPAVAAGTC